MTRHNDEVYLQHMLAHAREAFEILGGMSKEELEQSRVLQLALLHLVEIVGEAATRVSSDMRAKLSALPWRGMVSMRNRIIHGYDTIKVAVLWDTIIEDLPVLVASLEQVLGGEAAGDGL